MSNDLKEQFYIINASNIKVGDILCSRFDKDEKFLVLDNSKNLIFLEINTGFFVYPTPLDVINNFLKVSGDD